MKALLKELSRGGRVARTPKEEGLLLVTRSSVPAVMFSTVFVFLASRTLERKRDCWQSKDRAKHFVVDSKIYH